MQALSTHLGHRSTRLVQNVLFTLRNLSDAATKTDHLDDLLRQLMMLLGSNDATIVNCTVGVLSNLTCNNAKNKTIVCQLHGVEVCFKDTVRGLKAKERRREEGGGGRESRKRRGRVEAGKKDIQTGRNSEMGIFILLFLFFFSFSLGSSSCDHQCW